MHTNVAIIGSGPAGLTAAIYTSRARLNPIVFAGASVGGQLTTTTDVENYPGFPDGIMGPQLMQNMITQAEKFGTTLVRENVDKVEVSDDPKQKPHTLHVAGEVYTADTIIIATGSTSRKLGIESEETFWSKGVSTCATCDGAFFRDKVIAVVGGGDSAMEEATFLTKFASKVYIIHRRDEFRASKIMQERTLSNEKIEVLWNSGVVEVLGDQFVTGLKLENVKTGEIFEIETSAMFLAIGHIPQTTFIEGQIELDDHGYVVTNDDVHTSKEGVFVAGDVSDPIYKQAITAAGAGCKAAIAVERFLEG